MTLRSSIAALVVLAATASWGQSSAGPLTNRHQTVMATTNNAEAMAASARAKGQADQRLQEMGSTLTRMHTLLKQMKAKNSASGSKDSAAKANLEMWSLMLDQLDKQYEQLAAANKAREDMEIRRQALYKQADEKAAASAAAARAEQARAQQAKAAEEAKSATPALTPAATSTPAATAAPSTNSSPN
jgi:hypothetical protein